jgi:hypothetical protein
MAVRAIFCFCAICKLHIVFMGRAATIKSVKMFKAPFAYHKLRIRSLALSYVNIGIQDTLMFVDTLCSWLLRDFPKGVDWNASKYSRHD